MCLLEFCRPRAKAVKHNVFHAFVTAPRGGACVILERHASYRFLARQLMGLQRLMTTVSQDDT